MTPRESDATLAVDAAARALWARHQQKFMELGAPKALRDFDDLDPVQKRAARDEVLPMVWAALEALPDHLADGWDEGYQQAVADIHGVVPTPEEYGTPNPHRGGGRA